MTRWLILLTFFALYPQIAVPGDRTRLVVAVIDSGLNLNDSRFTRFLCPGALSRDFTREGIQDDIGHGTHVTGLIVKKNDPRKFCLVIIKVFGRNGKTRGDSYEYAIRYLQHLRPNVVNFSLSGKSFNEEEFLLVRENPKTRFFVAAGNDNIDLSRKRSFPASHSERFENVTVVGSLQEDGTKSETSNYGAPSMVWEIGEHIVSTVPKGYESRSGTSMSTAIRTGKFIHAQ